MIAPVIIPTLCRLEHFKRLLESLKRNSWAKYTDVYIGLDYPPSQKYEKGWREINEYLDNGDFTVFHSFKVYKWEENLGVGKNNAKLVDVIYKKYDRFIILEDDIEVSPNFLEYMNKCLDAFERDSDVVAVAGYSYPIDWDVSNDATCMRQNFNASMWGTGFWKSKLQQMDKDIRSGKMLDDVNKVIRSGSYKNMIDACLREYIPAALTPYRRMHKLMLVPTDMAVRAYLAVEGKYVISPVISKTRNHGFDGSGVYCQIINSEMNGNTAGSYNYSQQPIDKENTFELVFNEKDSIEENRGCKIANSNEKNTFVYMANDPYRCVGGKVLCANTFSFRFLFEGL